MTNMTFKTFLAAATLGASAPALAQAVPAAVIAVVDLDRVTSECVACKAANTALQSQVTGLRSRQTALASPLDTERKSIQTAVTALAGKEPDAALQARIQAFQTRQEQGAEELQKSQTQIQRNQAYIQQQISAKLGPIYQSVMQRRGANLMLEVGSTLAASNTVDVTADVLTALNAGLKTLSTTAPAQAAPQGR